MKFLITLFCSILVLTSTITGQTNKVVVLTADCAIHPACADYVRSGIEIATEEDAECMVIQLNTPGGLLKSTRVIVSDIL